MRKQARMNREEIEQIHLFNWVRYHENKYKELKLLFHIPNGGLRSKTEAKRFKAGGVKAGVPDLFLPVADKGYFGLFIEMKAEKGKISESQKKWIEELKKENYKAVVCYSWVEAVKELCNYLTIPCDVD